MSGILQTFNNISYSKERLEDGRLKLNVEIANERFETVKESVYERLASSVKLAGFRPGKAPKNLIEAQLGPTLFEETLGKLLPECTVEIIKRENLMPLDQIAYKVEKVAAGEGVKYSAVFTTFPEFKLPDISQIQVEKKKVEVSEEEIEKVVEQMFEDQQKKEKEGAKKAKTSQRGKADDNWAASLNIGVKNLKELRKKVKGELTRQKETMEKNRYVGEIIKKVGEKSKFDIPKMLIDQEVEKRERQYKSRIENLGMKVEDFLRNQKTTLEELKKGWQKEAEEALRAEIILMQVAKDHNIEVEEKEVNGQINAIKDENLKKQYQTDQARRYITGVLLRQKVIKKILELVK